MSKLSYILIALSALLILSFQNCAKNTQFAESTDVASLGNGMYEEKFNVQGTDLTGRRSLDMVWVVDNSGSMDTEAALVRNNLQAFINSMSGVTDMHMLLISKAGTSGTSVSFPTGVSSDRFKAVNTTIGSKDGPSIMINVIPSFMNTNPGFFRADAKKAIVFVTDDNSSMTATTFLQKLQNPLGWSLGSISIYGFIGQGTSSPCQASTGKVYDTMAQQTGGATYNICATDWSAHFTNLSNSIVSNMSVNRSMTLSQGNVVEITSVAIADVPQSADKYTLVGNALVISDAVKLNPGDQIVVQYRVAQ